MDFKEIDESFNKKFTLVFQAYLLKWPEVYAVANQPASAVAKCLADLIYRRGLPSTTMSQSSYMTYYKILLLFFGS